MYVKDLAPGPRIMDDYYFSNQAVFSTFLFNDIRISSNCSTVNGKTLWGFLRGTAYEAHKAEGLYSSTSLVVKEGYDESMQMKYVVTKNGSTYYLGTPRDESESEKQSLPSTSSSSSSSSSSNNNKRVLRSVTQPARDKAKQVALQKQQRKKHLFGLLRSHVRLLGPRRLHLQRVTHQREAWKAFKASMVCGGCQAPTDMVGANVCSNCTTHKIDICFGCATKLTPDQRTWIVQCRDPGIYYRDMDYLKACLIPGTGEIGSGTARYCGPTDDTRGNGADGFEGPIPVRRYAYYALARWQMPWREDARRRPNNGGDCTKWSPTGCWVPGSREEMRRLPYCAPCALALERDREGAPMMRWNSWQLATWPFGGCHGEAPLTTAAQLHFC